MRFELDCATRAVRCAINSVDQGVVFTDLPNEEIFPVIVMYGDSRSVVMGALEIVAASRPGFWSGVSEPALDFDFRLKINDCALTRLGEIIRAATAIALDASADISPNCLRRAFKIRERLKAASAW